MKLKEGILAVLSGILLFLSTLEETKFLIWISLVPLFIALQNKKAKLWDATLLGFITGIFYLALGYHWITMYKPVMIWIIPAASSFFILFSLIFNYINKKNSIINFILTPVIWILLQFIFSLTIIGSFWADLGIVYPELAKNLLGMQGTTSMIIYLGLFVSHLAVKDKQIKKLSIIFILMVLIFLGSMVLNPDNADFKNKIKVAAIQGNIYEPWNWREDFPEEVFKVYENLTLEASKDGPDLIIWPEYSIPADLFKKTNLIKNISELAKKTKSYLIIGTLIEKENSSRYYDSAIIFNKEGEIEGIYKSIRPDPYNIEEVEPEKEYKILNTSLGNIAVMICYEDLIISPKIVKDASFIVVIANDMTFQNTNGMYLHSLASRVKAAENNKYVIRVTNTGITQLIDNKGQVIKSIKPLKDNLLIEEIFYK